MPTMKLIFFTRSLTLILAILINQVALANDKGFSVITAPETKQMMEQNKKVLLVNVLSSLEYEIQHIQNAISIPVHTLKTTKLLPEDKDTPLIFYCMGPR